MILSLVQLGKRIKRGASHSEAQRIAAGAEWTVPLMDRTLVDTLAGKEGNECLRC